MEGDYIKINRWLRPLSCIYGFCIGIRNQLFELNILKSRSFTTPVIAVGNITVGGAERHLMWSISSDCSGARQRWPY